MIKLPEPAHRGPDGTGSYFDSYTTEQMRQAIKDAYEDAAQACTNIAISPSNVILGVAIECSDAIRKLSENIHD